MSEIRKLHEDFVRALLASFRHDSDGNVSRITATGWERIELSVDRGGYANVAFLGEKLRAHRLIWALEHGSWPLSQIDHVDGDPLNNAPTNLRLCTPSQNGANKPPRAGNFKGVRQRWKNGRFTAYFHSEHLGVFDTAEEAARAHDAAALARFGEFAHLNFGGNHG